jgi:hypothetical protein
VEGGAAERDHEAARRIGIQSVREPWPIAPAAEVREDIFHRWSAGGPRVYGQACGFLEHNESLVLKQDRRQRGGALRWMSMQNFHFSPFP